MSNEDREKLRLLLVEDDESFRWITRRILKQVPGLEIAGEAADGLAGVEAARELQPDVVLLDLRMPRMDGFEALPLIRDAAPDARVIVYTGLSDERVQARVESLGAFDVVEKDPSPDRLFQALERARPQETTGTGTQGA